MIDNEGRTEPGRARVRRLATPRSRRLPTAADINRRAATPEIGDEIVSDRHARHEGAISGEMRTRFTSCKTIVHRTDGQKNERTVDQAADTLLAYV